MTIFPTRMSRRGFVAAAMAVTVVGLAPDEARSQSSGLTLDQAAAAARRQTGGKVLRAETKTSEGRETHEIRVLTKDRHVRTLRFPGKRRRKSKD